MAFIQYEGVGITAMSAAVPKRVIKNREYTDVFSAQEANDIVDKTGIVIAGICHAGSHFAGIRIGHDDRAGAGIQRQLGRRDLKMRQLIPDYL